MILVADHLFVVVFLQLFRKKKQHFRSRNWDNKFIYLPFLLLLLFIYLFFLLIYYLVFWRNKNEPPHGYPQTSFSLQYFYIFLIF